MKKVLITFFLLLFCFHIYAIETKEINDSAEEFKSSKFIQLDPIHIPNELKVIDDQIVQNATDVIIISGKHTVVYAQKKEEGYTKSYKDFYGLDVAIIPVENEPNIFLLKIFYYNWLTSKFDKKISKRISKYNVLNELRFALYELFFGETFVRENKDALEKKNFERIQAVSKMVEDQKKMLKKAAAKKKILENEKKPKKNEEKPEKLKREEKKKESKKETKAKPEEANSTEKPKGTVDKDVKSINAPNIEIAKEAKADTESNGLSKKKITEKKEDGDEHIEAASNNSLGIDPIPDGSATPKEEEFKFLSGISLENIETKGLLSVKTNLRYLNLGANYKIEYQTKFPYGYKFLMKAGIPIKKDNYQLSVARSLEGNFFLKILGGLRIITGLEYSSLPFVNLPTAGEGFKVIQNDILYLKLGLDYTFEWKDKEMSFGADISNSLIQKSSVEKVIQTNRTSFYYKSQIIGSHGIVLSLFNTQISGEFTGNTSGGALFYTYKFGN